MLAILALAFAIAGVICAAASYKFGGPILHIGVILIGVAVIILALPVAGINAKDSFLPLLGV